MSEKACANCHYLTKDNACPRCKSGSLSEDFGGLVVLFDPEGSAFAKAMNVIENGRYALKVR